MKSLILIIFIILVLILLILPGFLLIPEYFNYKCNTDEDILNKDCYCTCITKNKFFRYSDYEDCFSVCREIK